MSEYISLKYFSKSYETLFLYLFPFHRMHLKPTHLRNLIVPFSEICIFNIHNYDWTKRTKFLLAVIYGSLQRHSNGSKTFLKNRKKLKWSFMTIFEPSESFKLMNRPNLAWPDFNALWRYISQKIYKIGTWNFNTIFFQVFDLCN